ncbi:MAG TPA: alpha/beta hydrolase [Rhizomicrobium sp.]|jgi:pimeloyl-ACP methyl ester carboxylesterase
MATFSHGDVTIAYDDIGPREGGRPIVLLHGFASNRNENWKRLGWYGAFERKNIRFIAPDMRGHGESSKPHEPEAYAREKLVGDVFALLDHLGVAKADIMGFSMGTRIAMGAALAQPSRVDLLILGGIGGRLFEPPLAGNPMAAAMEAERIEDISEPLLRSFRQFADEQGEDRLALAALTRAPYSPFTRESVAQIPNETLVVAGSRDVLAGDPGELARAMANAKAVTLLGCDHFSAIAHALFKAAVFDFLDGTLE